MKVKRNRVWITLAGGIVTIGLGLLANGVYIAIQLNQLKQSELAHQAHIKQADAQIKAIQEEQKNKEEARKVAAHELAERVATGNISTEGIDASICIATKKHSNPASFDVIVNKKHCIQPLTYEPADLVTSSGATLRSGVIGAFNNLYAAAAAAGQAFSVTSSYRSYADQVATYSYWVSVSGRDSADTYSARPGYSEHQTGLAFDVAAPGCTLDCFGATTQYQWLQAHAADFGFIQRYYAGSEVMTGYKAEEWHYRYVGEVVAKDMKKKGIKTLEEYWGVPGGNY